jgi:hypothetical protein
VHAYDVVRADVREDESEINGEAETVGFTLVDSHNPLKSGFITHTFPFGS